ncbi:hypothetical protein MJC1_02916 [Methylocystis sp. MJC1]|jgi:hypothetical protein|uniref:hypothetical protein n=1 Tax=Methylocystis sp. MJC1 TaxID=2654282 RepID=UPI0019D11791|nr:hypothetical protein [Methylocystis sp. MJC1]KAF2989999.1 hypothetical protein MJC1_02916 [Methylocystis sp. MJC1]
MNRKLLAAALVAPILAWAPTSALAHGCYSKHHYRHHTKSSTNDTFGSSKSMQKKGSTSTSPGSSSQDLNQGGSSGSTAPSGSSGSSRGKGQGI